MVKAVRKIANVIEKAAWPRGLNRALVASTRRLTTGGLNKAALKKSTRGQVVSRLTAAAFHTLGKNGGWEEATVYIVGDWDPGATFGTQWFGMYQWAGWTASTWSNEDWDIWLAEKKMEALDALTRVAI